jgi:hypothetical protein
MEPTNPNSQAMETGLWTGRQQAFAMMSAKTSAAKAATIKELRDARAYEVLGLTWDNFCPQYLGVCRASADAIIRRYNDLGANYFRLAEICRVSPETYQAVAKNIQGDTIELNGESLALTAENAHKIRAGIRRLRGQLDAALDKNTEVVSDLFFRIDRLTKDIFQFNKQRKSETVRASLVELTDYGADQFSRLKQDIQGGGHSNA